MPNCVMTVKWNLGKTLVSIPLSCDFGIPPVHHIKPYVKIPKKLLSNITLLEQEETQCIPAFSTIGCTPYFSAFPSIFVWEYNVVDLWVDRKPRGEWQAAIYRNELTSTQQLMALPSNHTQLYTCWANHYRPNNASSIHSRFNICCMLKKDTSHLSACYTA